MTFKSYLELCKIFLKNPFILEILIYAEFNFHVTICSRKYDTLEQIGTKRYNIVSSFYVFTICNCIWCEISCISIYKLNEF